MSDLKQEQTDKIYEMMKFVMTDVMGKFTIVSNSLNDVSSQIKLLSAVSSQSPTRSEILDKIAAVVDLIKNVITVELEEDIQEHHKDITTFHQTNYDKIAGKMDARDKDQVVSNMEVKETLSQIKVLLNNLEKISDKVDDVDKIPDRVDKISEKVDKLVNTLNTFYKIACAFMGATPVLWILFEFIHNVNKAIPQK